jgi:hypothetical protein
MSREGKYPGCPLIAKLHETAIFIHERNKGEYLAYFALPRHPEVARAGFSMVSPCFWKDAYLTKS